MKKVWITFSIVALLIVGGYWLFYELSAPFHDVKTYELSEEAQELVDKCFEDIDSFRDYHAHLVGVGYGLSGCSVHSDMRDPLHVSEHLRYKIYLRASGVKNEELADKEYVERLIELMENGFQPNSKLVLLGFDKYYNEDGSVNEEKTHFYVPNEYVDSICIQYPDYFIPCISVHPYREDALEELEKWAKKGVKQVKWLPNAMGMNPSSPKCIPYYEIMKKYNMTLLSHAGHEGAVDAAEDQDYGNPLFLRLPLDHGVRVIMAHCASLGDNVDLDSEKKERVSNIDLFFRMMSNPCYQTLLYADISAITQFNRMEVLDSILTRTDLHSRLLNGSDYPLPAINVLVHTKKMEKMGYISGKERTLLNEIYRYNPLLFDYVMKRVIRHPEHRVGFSPQIFQKHPQLGY
ncbi:MAG: amidohydrolase family protein [Cytophagales bacterium]|nr:amidohydrolase family protein [Cytophagales bacterium]